MNPMLQALKDKKAKGLDVTILLGHPHDGQDEPLHDSTKDEMSDDDSKELGLAPDATELGEDQDQKDMALGKSGHHDNMMPGEEMIDHPDEEEDKKLIEEELAKAHMGKRSMVHRGMMKRHQASHKMMHKEEK